MTRMWIKHWNNQHLYFFESELHIFQKMTNFMQILCQFNLARNFFFHSFSSRLVEKSNKSSTLLTIYNFGDAVCPFEGREKQWTFMNKKKFCLWILSLFNKIQIICQKNFNVVAAWYYTFNDSVSYLTLKRNLLNFHFLELKKI